MNENTSVCKCSTVSDDEMMRLIGEEHWRFSTLLIIVSTLCSIPTFLNRNLFNNLTYFFDISLEHYDKANTYLIFNIIIRIFVLLITI